MWISGTRSLSHIEVVCGTMLLDEGRRFNCIVDIGLGQRRVRPHSLQEFIFIVSLLAKTSSALEKLEMKDLTLFRIHFLALVKNNKICIV